MSPAMYRLTFQPGRASEKIVHAFVATLRRVAALARFRRYDVVFMQRELLPFGPPVLERILKAIGARLVFDYDDALFIFKPSKFNHLASFFRDPKKTYKIFALSDCVLAGNDYLRDIAKKYANDARTFHVAEDTNRIQMRPPHAGNGHLVLGWLGSKSTEKYLNLIKETLAEVCRKFPGAKLRIVGGGDFTADFPVEHMAWSLDGELEALRTFDIGLMPLPDEEWSLGKSGGKARTYMAAGVPPVCTAIGYNLELICDGKTGYLVRSVDEWQEALVKLAADPALRQRIGEAARRHIAENFSVEGQAEKLAEILRDVAGQNRTA